MMEMYNILAVLFIALVVKLGITYTDYEEYFVMIGVLDVLYFIVILFYMMLA